MTYDYRCESCDHGWELSCRMDQRDSALTKPCPACNTKGKISREVNALAISYDGAKTLQQRAGRHFNDVLENIKKKCPAKLGDGTKCSINTL